MKPQEVADLFNCIIYYDDDLNHWIMVDIIIPICPEGNEKVEDFKVEDYKIFIWDWYYYDSTNKYDKYNFFKIPDGIIKWQGDLSKSIFIPGGHRE